jgi:6-pyruvoyltetrahydropterin/6-carboxytetrahydropterin synthase
MKLQTTCTKVFHNLPFAHRQHNHDGHCRLIHGHNWSFEITFVADRLDENLFVVDFGKLKWLRTWLEDHFDHTLVLNEDDPHLKRLQAFLETSGVTGGHTADDFAKIVVVPNCGAEGIAIWMIGELNKIFARLDMASDKPDGRNLRVQTIRAYEDEKNSATVSLQ